MKDDKDIEDGIYSLLARICYGTANSAAPFHVAVDGAHRVASEALCEGELNSLLGT